VPDASPSRPDWSSAAAFERFLHAHLPPARALGVRVDLLDGERVRLIAPLESNCNHRGVGFGGSASALALLGAWAALQHALDDQFGDSAGVGQAIEAVGGDASIRFLKPMRGDLIVEATAPGGWREAARRAQADGKAEIRASCVVTSAGRDCARVDATFVLLAPFRW
jgi:thioesterase domain-containing protein